MSLRVSRAHLKAAYRLARMRDSTEVARARRRGDRIALQIAAVHESAYGTSLRSRHRNILVASLIGRSGSSAFRLSTAAVSMSLTGSCFSSESALGPFHHGSRERGGTIYWAALPSDERRVQATKRTHLIHRPARDIFPPLGGARVFSYRI